MPKHEIRIAQQVFDIFDFASPQIVNSNDLHAVVEERAGRVRANHSSGARHVHLSGRNHHALTLIFD